ncbi:aromatic acid exporter family protein [Clostridium swellfunianum]|uniref:aromatic acid exporter family protein n=1 Tax=Clostridium swellfunianum TaxID=1367462 RepID=UPI00202F0871|nr:aromatic acid exporter family protein [Clostridium swellfunianum]MCM0647973.1 aromatic acid exporter family protein [Clostridium swellfunianum]
MKFIGYRTLKTAIGAAIAMILAASFGLKYGTAAGVIVILSVQSTKRQSIRVAIQRMGACVLALFLSSVLFNFLGYNAYVFGLFLLMFIPSAARFRFNEGIVVSSVLVTHLLVEKSTEVSLIVNELLLMIIGIGVALIMNLYMPSIDKKIKTNQAEIEDLIRDVLKHMSEALRLSAVSLKEDELFRSLESKIKKGRERAYKSLNNSLFSDNSYYAKYMDMRYQQLKTLKNMRKHFEKFSITYKQTEMIAGFTLRLSNSIHEYNTAEGLLKGLQELKDSFKAMELPKTREEFENRAMLYQFLNDLEQFLQIKNDFKKNLDEERHLDVF